jgi:Ca2+-binding RTX toxin-like protein
MLMLCAPSAWAGSVHVDSGVLYVENSYTTFDEFTDVRVLADEPLTAGAGCTKIQPGQVSCPRASIIRIVLTGTEGDDFVDIRPALTVPFTLDLRGGNDRVRQDGSGATAFDGGAGDDSIEAHGNASPGDVWSGGPGYDTAWVGGSPGARSLSLDGVANDGVAGENDNLMPDMEELHGGAGDDTIRGTAHDDALYGGDGNDTIYGLGGDDKLEGDGYCYRDQLYGGPGRDTLSLDSVTWIDGGPDDDTIELGETTCAWMGEAFGGAGTDTVDFSGAYLPWSLSLDDVANDGYGGHGNLHSDLENLKAGTGGMRLVGSDGPNVLIGGAGDDELDGGGGTDVLVGGDGYDRADYASHAEAVNLSLDGLANDGAAGEAENLGADIEDLRGGTGNDTLSGNDGDNLLDGGPGADTIAGGAGADAVDYSSRSENVRVDLSGSAGDDGADQEGDTVGADVEGAFGGSGQDHLIGNAGSGVLDGGFGDDLIVDPGGQDDLLGGYGIDTIESFDGAVDNVECGWGEDEVWRDGLDVLTGCESVHDGPRPMITPPTLTIGRPPIRTVPPVRPRPTPTVKDTTPPKLDAYGVKGRLRTLAVTVRCSEACRVDARLSRDGYGLAKGSLPAIAGGTRTLRMPLTRLGTRVRKGGGFRLELTLRDAAGNVRHVARHITLKR